MEKQIKTKSATFNANKPVHCSGIMHINSNGKSELQECYVVDIAGVHLEFMEEKVDLIVRDQYGQLHQICEDFVWHF
jgi:hypothetical protein